MVTRTSSNSSFKEFQPVAFSAFYVDSSTGLPAQGLLDKASQLLTRLNHTFEVCDIPLMIQEINLLEEAYNFLSSEDPLHDKITDTLRALRFMRDNLKVKEMSAEVFDSSSPSHLPTLMQETAVKISSGLSPLSENRLLGEGAFGIVHKWSIKDTVIARKQILPSKFNTSSFFEPERLIREGALLIALSHPHIVGISGFTISKIPSLWLEYVNRGTLCESFQNSTLYTKHNVVHILYGIASGLSYLHEKKVFHRDLHAGNVGLHEAPEGHFYTLTPKILDLELASRGDSHQALSTNTIFQPPEVLALNPELHAYALHKLSTKRTIQSTMGIEESIYNKTLDDLLEGSSVSKPDKHDIWSLGMLAFAILSRGDSVYFRRDPSKCSTHLLRSLKFSKLPYLWAMLQGKRVHRTKKKLAFRYEHPLTKVIMEHVVAPAFAFCPDARPSADVLAEKLKALSLKIEIDDKITQ